MTITPADVRAALALPPINAPARRLPKDVLAQHGAATVADRKLIERAIERLDWWTTLSPATVGIAASADEERPVPAIQLLSMTARTEPSQRLLTIIHRAIPVPIILATALPENTGTRLSLAPLRRAERITDHRVVERLVVAPNLTQLDDPAAAFLTSLALPGLPRTTLAVLYSALVERVEALEVATVTGRQFRLADDPAARRQALDRYSAANAEWLAARTAAKKEKSLAQQVALGNRVQKLKEVRDRTLGDLG